jgi:hypothetical protein
MACVIAVSECLLIGLIVHLLSIVDAYLMARKLQKGQSITPMQMGFACWIIILLIVAMPILIIGTLNGF